ncbi:lysine transporter LysE [Streptomyces abyssalis]|uniref:Lysine transporter LysE n=1 Tax=Streptomyces abyssalis TaxID=933944 RepID=A0A1E7JRU6_9ACTN|nr:LysE family translocator [Streptomyces abyssalis]OEU91623.1 lysine transporter LysE [Streptomyces abyssalis]OEU94241.1 lysine transporter LysE [Streptomyces abyssalis]OEV06426.1 lysine transporter LysE [Streptomyces nanshensis]
MVDLHRLAAFCAMSLLLSAVPGPSVLFVVGRALAHGRRAALASVTGNAVGGYVLVVAVALGLGSVVSRSAFLFGAVKIVGAAYLILLGVRAVRGSRSTLREGTARGRAAPTRTAPETAAPGGLRQGWEGFTVGVTNPKSIVFLMAVLPQFVDRAAGHVVVQMLLLGMAGALLQLASDSMWGLAASAARDWLARSPRRASLLGATGGIGMIGLGVTVAVTGRAEPA